MMHAVYVYIFLFNVARNDESIFFILMQHATVTAKYGCVVDGCGGKMYLTVLVYGFAEDKKNNQV